MDADRSAATTDLMCGEMVWHGWHRFRCSRRAKREVGNKWYCEQHAKKRERLAAIRNA